MSTARTRLRVLPPIALLGLSMATGYVILGARLRAGDGDKDGKAAVDMSGLRKARAVLAQKGYRTTSDLLRESKKIDNRVMIPASPEEVYTWSVRLLDAERDLSSRHDDRISALQGHLQRMTDLQKQVKRMLEELLPPKTAMDAEWYRLEAELWLAQARSK
jgi:hypothetical protein